MFIDDIQILDEDPKSKIKLFFSGILFTVDCKVVSEGLDQKKIVVGICHIFQDVVVVVGGDAGDCCGHSSSSGQEIVHILYIYINYKF